MQVESNQLISELFSLLPVPIAIADEEGRITLANSSFSDLFQGTFYISELPSSEIDVPEQGTFAVRLLPLNNAGYQIVYATDVTAQKQLGLQLDQMEKMAAIGRAVVGIGQDLKNPLTDIVEYSSLAEQCRMDAAARHILDVVVTSADRASHLIQSLLVIGASEKTAPVPIDLNEMVRNVTQQRSARHASQSLDVTLALDSALAKTIGVPSQIEQVITSLLIHAEDAVADGTPGAGSIRVQTGMREERVQVQIFDSGKTRLTAGIFASTSNGVGLNICGEIAKEHGGDLYAWSSYGGGTRLTLELPIYAPESEDGKSSVTLARMLRGKSVLVVDNDTAVSEFIADVLARHGAHVQISASGAEAYDRLYGTEYDLIVCNYLMLGLNGESLYHLMTSTNPQMSLRFLFLTGNAITSQARHFFKENEVPYLKKPFRIRELVEAVEGLFTRRQTLGF